METINFKNHREEYFTLSVQQQHLDEVLDQFNSTSKLTFITEPIIFSKPTSINLLDDDNNVIGSLVHEGSGIDGVRINHVSI